MKPLLKWVGGKTQIIDEVFDLFPRKMVNYYEPFVGGGSVLIELLRRKSMGEIIINGKILASDANPRLIWFYKNIQNSPRKVWEFLARLIHDFQNNHKPETMYYLQRKRYNEIDITCPEAAALFLFLNKTCFRGLYREGPRGFNVAFGNYKNVGFPLETDLLEVSALVTKVEFWCCSFEDTLTDTKDGDFVYLDPPYAPENDTSFVGYTKQGFGKDKHEKLFELIKSLTHRGVRILMSNADVEIVTSAFNNRDIFTIKTISCRRAINSKNPGSRTNEVLIRNFT